jgi:hypothetical protein
LLQRSVAGTAQAYADLLLLPLVLLLLLVCRT